MARKKVKLAESHTKCKGTVVKGNTSNTVPKHTAADQASSSGEVFTALWAASPQASALLGAQHHKVGFGLPRVGLLFCNSTPTSQNLSQVEGIGLALLPVVQKKGNPEAFTCKVA